jgi:tyrosyl-tRNA synthetase
MQNVYDILKDRGFIYQTTDDTALSDMLGKGSVTFYVGFDPTADSLHIGHLLPIMAMCHMQRAGHRPIAIVGGGTAMVGDPSGKTEMRKMLTPETIAANAEGIKAQLARYITFAGDRAVLRNNADWLGGLNYIEFLRDIGKHFSVNRMLTAESYKMRLETGLSFIEFNYMLLQSYDFYVLARDYQCLLQLGGQDQWGNIVAGIDLTRRMLAKEAYGITFPLITNAKGEKFGKSVAGAIWLDASRFPPFEYYQFFRNVEDSEVTRLLGLFTFLPMDEVRQLGSLTDPLINRAKEILAFEATKITHGREAAIQAYNSAVARFGQTDPNQQVATSSEIATVALDPYADLTLTRLPRADFEAGLPLAKLLVLAGLEKTNSDARRLIEQGGATINEEVIRDPRQLITLDAFKDGLIIARAGKKRFRKIMLES